jgi:hypothetical integral membrane protein (TIGR02206 family)
METFRAFGTTHLAALGAIAALGAALVAAGRRLDARGRAWMGRGFAAALVAYAAVAYARKLSAPGATLGDSLPLHLCDWVLALCVVGLLSGARWARELAYFWGLAGSMHGLVTPDLRADFPAWGYFQFFWGHGGVILAVVFFLGVGGLRPAKGGAWRAFLALNGYVAVVGTLDAAFGWNYGYLCRVAGRPSLLDHLGPMPWRLLVMEAIALASFALLELPWRLRSASTTSPRC